MHYADRYLLYKVHDKICVCVGGAGRGFERRDRDENISTKAPLLSRVKTPEFFCFFEPLYYYVYLIPYIILHIPAEFRIP